MAEAARTPFCFYTMYLLTGMEALLVNTLLVLLAAPSTYVFMVYGQHDF